MGRHDWAKGTVAALLLVGLAFAALKVPEWSGDTPAVETLDGIAQLLFQPWVLAFELLSILLLAALFGSLYLSQKVPPGEEEE